MGKRADNKSKSKLTRCIKAPFTVLCRARDFYVRSMTNCAGRPSYGNVAHVSNLPRSLSVSSSRLSDEDDYRELLRAASISRLAGMKMGMDQQQLMMQFAIGAQGMPRSQSVAIGRIDEDKPCDFHDDFNLLKTDFLYPRSRSYAVTKRTGMLA